MHCRPGVDPRSGTRAGSPPHLSPLRPRSGLGIANHVLLRSLVNGASLGIAYGGFKGIRCGLERQRGRQDLLNSAAAGSVSWAFLAATMSRGDRRTVAIGAVIGAVAMPLFDSFAIKVHTHPGGVPPGQGPRPGGGESADV